MLLRFTRLHLVVDVGATWLHTEFLCRGERWIEHDGSCSGTFGSHRTHVGRAKSVLCSRSRPDPATVAVSSRDADVLRVYSTVAQLMPQHSRVLHLFLSDCLCLCTSGAVGYTSVNFVAPSDWTAKCCLLTFPWLRSLRRFMQY